MAKTEAGSTNVRVPVQMFSNTTGAPSSGLLAANVSAYYVREGALPIEITVNVDASADAAYTARAWAELFPIATFPSLPVQAGTYYLHTPDDMWVDAAGVDQVMLYVFASGNRVFRREYELHGGPVDAAQRVLIANAIADRVFEVEGSLTFQQMMRILVSASAGVTDTSGTVLKTPNGVKTRITATVNGSNERTAITLTPDA